MSFMEDNIYLADPFGDGIDDIMTEEEEAEEATLFNSQARLWSAREEFDRTIAGFLNRRPCAEVQPCW